ncbi:DUF2793 domain-containing protein [Shimia ponticola]|uniref:DUF2793 domain-containing protein n=1 Tax=Shimia ponticola TaxID=2582893 RepID=UPI00164A4AAD|nr:DUF2793 domain-containing protein [Shimia ponticola]
MSVNTPVFGLPYIQAAQAQKHVTHNEALRVLDAVTQIAVIGVLAQPPAEPSDGMRVLVAAGASAEFAGHEHALAVREPGGWVFYSPASGWLAWDMGADMDAGRLLVWTGTAWEAAHPEQTDYDNLPGVGIATASDAINRLAVASEATLLTHAGAGHQLKLNKATATDTASLLFQTGFSGRAEMGTTGSDGFEIKVSADGSTFHTALLADEATGRIRFPSGTDGLADAAFGEGALLTTGYAAARGTDLVTNGTGMLGNAYNYPPEFTFEAGTTPNLPGAVSYAGHYPGPLAMSEFLPVDPNAVYRLRSYILQDSIPGDWSAYASGARHSQFMGLMCFDADHTEITALTHRRYRHAGVDSLTTLSAPLAPGDTIVEVADAAGWNESLAADHARGLILFGYKNSFGQSYTHYSRLYERDLFELGSVDKTNNRITLNAPLPASLANPDDPGGVWPVGTRIANTLSGGNFKYSLMSGLILDETDRWYLCENHMGGLDLSGDNVSKNFPPGTAYVKVFWLPNYSNRAGGWGGHPDTGLNHKVLFSGISVLPEPLAAQKTTALGAVDIKVPVTDFDAGTVALIPQAQRVISLSL